MKSFLCTIALVFSVFVLAQDTTDKTEIEATLNNYIDAFYKGDTTKLKAAIKPRLYKFGYWKNKETGEYEYYDDMTYDKAMKFVQAMKDEGRTRDENTIRTVEVLDIGNHIASAKVTASWGIDYVLLSKDDGQWMIEQVIWEGPYQKENNQQKTTTYYLIRHAEKDTSDKTNKDPHLTDKGLKRAKNWVNVFKDVKFDKVYTTKYNRTVETASPSAKANNVILSFYEPRKLDLKAFKTETNGKTVLIVGHSNTTPMLANALLGEKKYTQLDENSFSQVFIVTVTDKTKTATNLSVD